MKKFVKCDILSVSVYGDEVWTLRKVDQKYVESREWCLERMWKINWTERVKSDEVLRTVNEERNIQRTI